MKERPILFSAPMIRALLAGTKTQTRRAVKWRSLTPGINLSFSGLSVERSGSNFVLTSPGRTSQEYRSVPQPCPYGLPGDRLWVRETWAPEQYDQLATTVAEIEGTLNKPAYKADWDAMPTGLPAHHWKPSIHMPRAVSRITLEVTNVRVEPLQDISDDDAAAEGCPCYVCGRIMDGRSEDDCHCFHRKGARSDYRDLWESINGAGSWDANPFVWVVAFKRIEP